MDPLSLAGVAISVARLFIGATTSNYYQPIIQSLSLRSYLTLYGVSGFFFWLYGNDNVWRMQVELLGSLNADDSARFKKLVQEECGMIAVAVCFFIRFYAFQHF